MIYCSQFWPHFGSMASTSQPAHAVVEMQPPVSFLPAPAAALVHWLLTLSIGCLLNSLGTHNPWREGTGNWRCRHSWIKHKWYLSWTHNPWREGTGGADTAWIKHKWCGISFIPWTSCPSSVVHHTYVATESKQFLCTYMDLWWSEAASDGTKMREHSRQSCWSNHFCSPKWTTLELEGKRFSTEEGIALASFSLYQAVLFISKLLYLCRALANLPEEEPSVTAVPSPSWTTLPYSNRCSFSSSGRHCLLLQTILNISNSPSMFHISSCTSGMLIILCKIWHKTVENQCAYLHSRNAHHQQANMFLHFVMVLVLCTITKCATDFHLKLYTKIMRSLEMCTFTSAE